MRKLEIRGLLAFILTVLLVLAPFPGGFAFADETTTLTATADARINQGQPTTNYGTQTTLFTGTVTNNNQRSLVRFTLPDAGASPALPSDSSIKVSALGMQMTTAPGTSSTQAVHRVTNSTLWTEGAVNWNTLNGTTPWTTAGGDFFATAAASTSSGTTSNVALSWTILGDTGVGNIPQSWLTGAITNNGLLIKDSSEGGGSFANADNVQGSVKGATSVATTALTVPTSPNLYLAAISLSTGTVTGVSGGGVTWSIVQAQCSGDGTNRTEVWKAWGTGTATAVTATVSASANLAINVTRFAGADATTPIGATTSANTNGVNGACTGGPTSVTPSVTLTTTTPNSLAFGAVSTASYTFTLGAGFTLLVNNSGPGGGAKLGMGTEYKAVATPAATAVSATLGKTANWSIVAVEIKRDTAPVYNSLDAGSNKPTLQVRHLRNVALNSPTAGVSEITHSWTFPSGAAVGSYDGVLFSKLQGGTAPSGTPVENGTSYTVGQVITGSETVVINTSAVTTVSAIDENGADSVVLPNTQYTYKAYTHDSVSITGAATVLPPHYAAGVASASVSTNTGGGANKNWKYKTGAATLAPPSLNPDTGVIAGSNDNKVHSMSASTGGRKYQPAGSTGITGGAIQSRAAVIPQGDSSLISCSCDVVYVGAGDGKVYAFNAATGLLLWSKQLTVTGGIQGGPAVQVWSYSDASYKASRSTDLVVVGTRNLSDTTANKIYGLDGNDGTIVWTFAPGNLDIINSTPWINYADNTLWVTSRSNSNTQPSIWKLNTVSTGTFTAPVASITLSTTYKDIDTSPTLNEGAAAATFLYAVTAGNDLVAVRLLDNAVSTINVSGTAGGGAGFPIPIVDGTTLNWDDIYFTLSGGSGGVYKRRFDRLNNTFGGACSSPNCWDRTLAGASTPIFTPGGSLAIYVGATDGLIHKLNPASGLDLDTRMVNAAATTGDPSFDVVANRIYIGASDGRIYSFDKF